MRCGRWLCWYLLELSLGIHVTVLQKAVERMSIYLQVCLGDGISGQQIRGGGSDCTLLCSICWIEYIACARQAFLILAADLALPAWVL